MASKVAAWSTASVYEKSFRVKETLASKNAMDGNGNSS